MKTNLPAFDHYVYPGEFVPSINEEKVKTRRISNKPKSCAYTKELPGSYEVEISMPCIEREQLVIYAVNNKLSVAAYTNENSIYKGENLYSQVVLPLNADTELTIAEYTNSVLHCYIPKTKQPAKHSATRIVVY